MATFKYRINKGAWQTVQLTAMECTGLTLLNNEQYPVPEGYVGTYLASGTTENKHEYANMLLYVWYCSSTNKTVYSKMPCQFTELYVTDDFDPWGYSEDVLFYVDHYDGDFKNMVFNMNIPQKVTLNLNAGDEVEVVCASLPLFNDTLETTGGTTFAHVIRYDASFPHDVFGNINSASYGEGFDGPNATFGGFDEIDEYEDGETSYIWYPISQEWLKTSPGLLSEQYNLISAKNLLIHNLENNSYCARKMFYGCHNLIEAPEFLPEINLPSSSITNFPWSDTQIGCYSNMFSKCLNLKLCPKLPATTVHYQSYKNMFYGCSCIEKSPDLPAITIDNECYESMFQGCSNLTGTTKILPATVLSSYCYKNMFCGTKIKTAPVLPATSLEWGCYDSMFMNCQDLVSAPELPAIETKDYCYSHMFYGCVALTTPPALPATGITTYCYSYMFNKCRSLTTAPALPALAVKNYSYTYMFQDCYSLTVAPELPATTLSDSCYYGMFYSCSGLTGAPETLPATALSKSCYARMFQYCSFTTAPILPARTVSDNAYEYMFAGCNSLNYVKAMFTNTPGDTYANRYRTRMWLSNVSPTGTFVKNASATWSLSGSSGIPEGWTVETATE